MSALRSPRVRRAGASGPSEPQPPFAWTELIRETWHRWCAYRRRSAGLAASRFSEPAVHDFRVSAQRLLAALRVAEHLIEGSEPHALRRHVRRRFRAFRRLRDVQVMHLALAPIPPQRPLASRLRRRLGLEARKLCSGLKRDRRRRDDERDAALMRSVLRALVAMARTASDADLTGAMRSDLETVRERIAGHIRRMDAEDLGTLHQLRLAIKRARYVLEIVAATHGLEEAKAACRAAQAWQDLLGTLRDLQVLAAELETLPVRGHRERAHLRLFTARLARDQTEAIRTLLRQRPELERFCQAVQCLPRPAARSRHRAS